MKEILKRWLDIVLVYVAGALILHVLLSIFFNHATKPFDWLNQQYGYIRIPTVFLLSSALWLFIHKSGGIRLFNDIRNFPRYPSIWLSTLLFTFIFLAIPAFIWISPASQQQLTVAASNIAAFLVSLVLVGGVCFIFKPQMNHKNTDVSPSNSDIDALDSPDKIIEWSQSELPICNESDDLFDHKYIASKINHVLKTGTNKNVGIIGYYGSGKSSIINLIESKKGKKDILCKIEGWGFKENTAVEHVLQLVIEEQYCPINLRLF